MMAKSTKAPAAPKVTRYQSFSVERVQRSGLSFMPGNPQSMDEEQTAALTDALNVDGGGVGLLQTIVVNRRTWHVVGGNHRLREIDRLEMFDPVTSANDYWLDVATIDVDEDRERAIVLALNNPRLQGQPRIDALRSFLEAVPDSERGRTGFTSDDCSFLLGAEGVTSKVDTDKKLSIGQLLWAQQFKSGRDESQLNESHDVPDPPTTPLTQPGDVWTLGSHRLMCGDSTSQASLDKLLGGVVAEMMFADPPYGVDYDGGLFHSEKPNVNHKREKLDGDKSTDLYGPFLKAISGRVEGPCYVWFAGSKGGAVYDAVEAIKGDISTLIVWHKTNATYAAMGSQYKPRHEPCLYFKTPGATLRWVGPSDARSLWEGPRNAKNDLHPTQKPVWLAVNALRNHKAATILDPFGGSGIVVMAAEHLGRTCYTMEVDPGYCDVILMRWRNFTGLEPVRESDGVRLCELVPYDGERTSDELSPEADVDVDSEEVETTIVEEVDD